MTRGIRNVGFSVFEDNGQLILNIEEYIVPHTRPCRPDPVHPCTPVAE